jgi:hypothetical protein
LPQQGETGVCTQASPLSSQVSVVQASVSPQARGVPGAHAPPWHASPTVQKAPSSHEVPFTRLGCVQAPAAQTSVVQVLPSSVQLPVRGLVVHPVAELQPSLVHSLPSSQMRAGPGTHAPAPSQTSPSVHASLSVQEVPEPAGVLLQVSFSSSQVSTVHELVSMQLAVPPLQAPA